MGGKGKSPAAPDYSQIAASNEEAARISASVARENLAWAKEAYTQDKAVSDRVVESMLGTMDAESAAAAEDRKRYQSTFQGVEDQFVKQSLDDRARYEQVFRPMEDKMVEDAWTDRQRYQQQFRPLEDQLAADAASYNSPQRQEAEAARVATDVAQTFDAQRKSALAALESYGVDPGQARAGALDTGVRIAQATASAQGQNDARRYIEQVGMALRGDAINVGQTAKGNMGAVSALGGNLAGGTANAVNLGRGYPGQIASGYQTATGAGTSAISGGLATTASGAGTMGTGVQWQGLQNQTLGNWGSQVSSMRNTATSQQAESSRAAAGGVGSMVGAVAGIALGAMTGGAGLALTPALMQAGGAAAGGR